MEKSSIGLVDREFKKKLRAVRRRRVLAQLDPLFLRHGFVEEHLKSETGLIQLIQKVYNESLWFSSNWLGITS